MNLTTEQKELRDGYLRGGPGAVVSGLVWLLAGMTAARAGVRTGFVVLFFGGMLIFPVATLVLRSVFRRVTTPPSNPGGLTVIETVFPMMGGFLAAWLLLPHRPDTVFPIAAVAVGAHYFGFRTAYGDWAYWALGAVMCLVGLGAIFVEMPTAATVPYVIAAIEILVGVWFTRASLADARATTVTRR